MRRAMHFALVLLGMIPLTIAWACMALGVLVMVWADMVHSDARRGNCWSYAAPRWWRQGGYLGMRSADGVRLCGFGLVPHVVHVEALGDGSRISHTLPTNRYVGRWLLWRKLYFRFTVAESDERRT